MRLSYVKVSSVLVQGMWEQHRVWSHKCFVVLVRFAAIKEAKISTVYEEGVWRPQLEYPMW